jgi:acyl-coenzyme A thioesterase PaaI-like protein
MPRWPGSKTTAGGSLTAATSRRTCRRRKNIVQARSFAGMLEQTIRRYQNRAIEAAQVIEELIALEYKANFLAPAQGEKLLARGRVIRPGRTVTVCAGDVVAVEGGHEKLVAPPTINDQVPDPDCELHYGPNRPVAVPIRAAISNSFGFGGHNDCLLVRAHGG